MDHKGIQRRPASRSQSQNGIVLRKSRGRWQRMKKCNFRPVCNKPKSYKDIWCLPDEILLHIFKGLHVKDLLNVRSAHPDFRDLIDNSPSLWASISFQDTWPSLPNVRHFKQAADSGNIEALIKTGVAYLYNEGFPGDFEGKRITINGELAAEMFCKVESLTPNTTPFTWLFIRPPWAVRGACCKECVFNNMKRFVDQTKNPCVEVCIAKTLQLLEHENAQTEMVSYLQSGAAHGSTVAAHLLWENQYSSSVLDKGGELKSLRALREVAKLGHMDSQLSLCHAYVSGKYGGYPHQHAAQFVRNFVQSSRASNIHDVYRNNKSELNHSMRYILMDWLVEVANMKDFESITLHVAIELVDCYLKKHSITRSKLQLLGVSAMVLCSRFLGKDIITIREAAWLTDNTYKYEDVVRMMGEITATLKGNLRVLTSLDYTVLLGKAAQNDAVTQKLAEYICELSLLQSSLGCHSKSRIAASSVLLARFTMKKDLPWCQKIQDFSGYSLKDLIPCTVAIHDRCFQEDAIVDHRSVKLQAVNLRYGEASFHSVSKIQMIDSLLLCQTLSLDSQFGETLPPPASPQPSSTRDLIASPSRSGRSHAARPCQINADREQAATPTLESIANNSGLVTPDKCDVIVITDDEFEDIDDAQDTSCDMLNDSMMSDIDRLNDSNLSGYDGDKEDEGDASIELGYDSDADLESLWCMDRAKNAPEPQSHDESENDASDSFETVWSPSQKNKTLKHHMVKLESQIEKINAKLVTGTQKSLPKPSSSSPGQDLENQPSCRECNSKTLKRQPIRKRSALQNLSINVLPTERSAPLKRKSPPISGRVARRKPNVL